MTIINYKNSDTKGKQFDFEISNEFLGTLTLLNDFGLRATYTTTRDSIQFRQFGILNNKVLLKKNNRLIGQIKNRLFSKSFILFESEKTYFLSSNIVGRNLKWIDSRGFPLVEYTMALRKTMSKGTIKINGTLSTDDMEILISAGLIAGRLKANRFAFFLLAIPSFWLALIKFI